MKSSRSCFKHVEQCFCVLYNHWLPCYWISFKKKCQGHSSGRGFHGPNRFLKIACFSSAVKIFTSKCQIIRIFQKPIKMYEWWQQQECFHSLYLCPWASESDNTTIGAFLLIRKRSRCWAWKGWVMSSDLEKWESPARGESQANLGPKMSTADFLTDKNITAGFSEETPKLKILLAKFKRIAPVELALPLLAGTTQFFLRPHSRSHPPTLFTQ